MMRALNFGSAGLSRVRSDGAPAPVNELLPQPSRIIAHWDASDTATLPVVANGTSIASWSDKVSGYQFAQATSANQPKYVANAQGGKAGVSGDGTQFMTLPVGNAPLLQSAIASGRYTVIAVYKDVVTRPRGEHRVFRQLDGRHLRAVAPRQWHAGLVVPQQSGDHAPRLQLYGVHRDLVGGR